MSSIVFCLLLSWSRWFILFESLLYDISALHRLANIIITEKIK